jgi:hypothetical protein
MKTVILPLIITASSLSIIVGTFLHLKAALAIEMQRKFYLNINWRIEPVSMEKELSNTKVMGRMLVFIGIVTVLVYAMMTV